MIVQEIIEDYTTLVKTYSNAGFMIRKKGILSGNRHSSKQGWYWIEQHEENSNED